MAETPGEIPPKSNVIVNPLASNSNTTNGSNLENTVVKNQLLKEIARIDKWTSVGADNGLFLINEKVEGIYDKIVQALKDARISHEKNDFPETQRQLSIALQDYSKAIHSTSWKWRFVNLNGGYVFIYLLSLLILISSFYAFLGIKGFELVDQMAKPPFGLVGESAIHAVTWGMIGGILRGMWYLKDKVGDRKFRSSWNIYFISVPFIGGLFGAIIYLIIVAGLLAFNPQEAQPIPETTPAVNQTVMTLQDRVSSLSDSTKQMSAQPTDEPTPATSTGIATPGTAAGASILEANSNSKMMSISFIPVQQANTSTAPSAAPEEIPSITTKSIPLDVVTKINQTAEELIKEVAALKAELTKEQPSEIIGQPLTIIPFAALAGFNWEWLLTTFKRVGDTRSGRDNKEFGKMLEEDLTKLDP